MNSQPKMPSPSSKFRRVTKRLRFGSPLGLLALPAMLLLAVDPNAATAGPPKSSKSSNKASNKAKGKGKDKAEPKLELRKAVNQIDGLTIEELDDGTTILRLLGHVEPTFNVYRLSDPDRLVVDIAQSERGKAVPHAPVDSWAVGRVTISSVEEHDSAIARVVVNLKRESSYIVVPKGRDLAITITPREVAPEAYFARKSAGERQAEIETARKQAAALEAKAKANATRANSQASSAEDRADEAESRATQAKARATKAEAEAAKIRAEAEAIKANAEAQARARQAEAETQARAREAEGEKNASAREREAELLAARRTEQAERNARAVEAEAKKQAKAAAANAAANARAVEAEAQKQARAAKARAEQLEAEAKKLAANARANAKKLEADAAKRVQRADADAAKRAKQAAAKAKKLETDARAVADAAAAKARKLESQAEAAASKIESEAAGKLSEVRLLADARKSELADAEVAAAEAERRAKHAEQRASAAKAEANAAETYAKRVRDSADDKAARAEELLTDADEALRRISEESDHAQGAYDEAKKALGDARKAARKLGNTDDGKRVELDRAVAQADAAAKAAKEREDQANERLATLEREREQLADKQAAVDKQRAVLEGKQTELATAQAKLAQAKADYERLGGDRGPKGSKQAHRKAKSAVASATSKVGKARKQHEAVEAKVEDLEQHTVAASEELGSVLADNRQRRSLTKQWNDERAAAGLAKVRDVRFEDGPTEARVVVELSGPVIYDASSLTPNMTMLEIRDTQIPTGLERSLDTTSFHGPIDRITSFREGDDVKIVVASPHGEPAGIELDRKANRLIWKFPKVARADRPDASQVASAGSPPEGDARMAQAPRPEAPPKRTEVVSLGGNKVSGFSTPGVLAARPGTAVGKRSRWRGERIDIELQDAPIKDVLLLFSDIGRVNIIAGPEVQGTVTMKLSAVPWDQALDIILRSLTLGMVQEGNVIRVSTQSNLEEERRKAIEEANAAVQLKPLETRLIPLSYAAVQEMLPKVQSVLSSRGSVTPDSRTNMLVVMDVAENIALAESLVRQLDSQTPQVLIEARIVEARTNWLRQLGIQWGFDFVASPGTGNPTGLLFPNSLGVAGGSGSNQSPVNGLILPGAAANPNYAVDLPAPVSTGTGGAIGFSFGSLSGNLNTNLRLSAAEDEGEVRIISAPKIVTLDNTQAQIEQGVQIPISQVSAQGVNTRYVNATLGLRVTPRVTNEGAVVLEVQVQKNEADFVNTGARGDPTILTKSAQSQLLIVDGDTAVIGGIYTRNQAVNHSKVPWFADIPIIGWFFKNKTERDDRSEMLIFLTPRIVNRSTSIGG